MCAPSESMYFFWIFAWLISWQCGSMSSVCMWLLSFFCAVGPSDDMWHLQFHRKRFKILPKVILLEGSIILALRQICAFTSRMSLIHLLKDIFYWKHSSVNIEWTVFCLYFVCLYLLEMYDDVFGCHSTLRTTQITTQPTNTEGSAGEGCHIICLDGLGTPYVHDAKWIDNVGVDEINVQSYLISLIECEE